MSGACCSDRLLMVVHPARADVCTIAVVQLASFVREGRVWRGGGMHTLPYAGNSSLSETVKHTHLARPINVCIQEIQRQHLWIHMCVCMCFARGAWCMVHGRGTKEMPVVQIIC